MNTIIQGGREKPRLSDSTAILRDASRWENLIDSPLVDALSYTNIITSPLLSFSRANYITMLWTALNPKFSLSLHLSSVILHAIYRPWALILRQCEK